MQEIVYDTNKLIEFLKNDKPAPAGFTTILNVVEFPLSLELEQLTVIYPNLEDYQESIEIATALLQNGTPMPAVDIMVAAMCIKRNLTLCTKDIHFAAVKKVKKDFKLELTK